MNQSRDFQLTGGLLALALLVGGAGLSFPMLQLALCAAALGVAAVFIVTRRGQPSGPLDRWAYLLVSLMLLLPLAQLVPLPPALWHALPGRDIAVQVDSNLGWSMWRPWTLDIERTIRSWLILIPPIVIFVGCLRLASRERRRLLWIVVGFALLNALLGILQLVTGGTFTPYPSAHKGYPLGLFVNRNHSAMLFLAAIPIAAFLGAMRIQSGKQRTAILALTISAVVFLAILVIGSTSRMALGLLPLALLIALFLIYFGPTRWRMALPATVALAAVGVTLFAFGGFNRSLSRFSSMDDSRFDFWTDLSWALQEYGLAGTGFGTFVPVHQSAESLAAVSKSVINHAHNDYLEILLEGGIPAIALLLMLVAILAASIVSLLRSRASLERAMSGVAAAGSIVLLLMSSLVDYPLRMPALGGLFAVLCAILLPARRHGAGRGKAAQAQTRPHAGTGRESVRQWPLAARAALLFGLAATFVVAVQAGLSAQALQREEPAIAASWAGWSTRAYEQQATSHLTKLQPADAVAAANAALRLSPISTPGIRTAAIVMMLQNTGSGGASRRVGGAEGLQRQKRAAELMYIAAALGWRDPTVQLWVIDAALRVGDAATAVQRAEALFRQERFPPAALALLLRAPERAETINALVGALSRQPAWRAEFIAMGTGLQGTDASAFEQLLTKIASTPPGLMPAESDAVVDSRIERRDFEAAGRIWSLSRRAGLITNGGFERGTSTRSGDRPEGWSFHSAVQISPTVDPAAPGVRDNALRIVDSNRGRPILSQRLLLRPGTYRLSFRANAKVPIPVSLRWELKCAATGSVGADTSLGDGSGWREFHTDLTVPLQDCPVQRLALLIVGDIASQDILIDDVRLGSVRLTQN